MRPSARPRPFQPLGGCAVCFPWPIRDHDPSRSTWGASPDSSQGRVCRVPPLLPSSLTSVSPGAPPGSPDGQLSLVFVFTASERVGGGRGRRPMPFASVWVSKF